MPSGKPTKEVPASYKGSDARTNPFTGTRFIVAEPDAILHDRDGKEYPAVILREWQAPTARGHMRTYAELRYQWRPGEWAETSAVAFDAGDRLGKKWYERIEAKKTPDQIDEAIAKLDRQKEKLIKESLELKKSKKPAPKQEAAGESDPSGTEGEGKPEENDAPDGTEGEGDPDPDQDEDQLPEDNDEDGEVDLDTLTAKQLREYAKSSGVEVPKNAKKADIVKALKAAGL